MTSVHTLWSLEYLCSHPLVTPSVHTPPSTPLCPRPSAHTPHAQVVSEPPEYYNNDTKLGGAIKGAVDAKGFVTRWPQLLLEGVPQIQRVMVGDHKLLERLLLRSDTLVRTCAEGETALVEMSFGLGPVLAQVAGWGGRVRVAGWGDGIRVVGWDGGHPHPRGLSTPLPPYTLQP